MRSKEVATAVKNIELRKALISQWTVDLSALLHSAGVQFNPETTSLGELERQLVLLGKITVPVT